MDYILAYSLSLLLYQTLYTAEQYRIVQQLSQFVKSTALELAHGNLHSHGPYRDAAAH